MKTLRERFESKYVPEPNTGCWLWIACTNSDGYGHIKVNGNQVRAHRLSYELSNGDIPDGLGVLHKCDVRSCVNPEHLFIGTQQDNVTDMLKKGRANYPTENNHGRSKLTKENVYQIRKRLERGHTQYEIAKSFGVTRSNISYIKAFKTWNAD
jgi:hypothetical protein